MTLPRAAEVAAPPRRRAMSTRRAREITLGYLLLAPAIGLLLIFEFYPLFFG
ncbi:MAG: sugar ABC transporter permease, partial [Chloroflexi bacterium]|nr:sugar ABC transporter permease [Chloroflexota bacterium]